MLVFRAPRFYLDGRPTGQKNSQNTVSTNDLSPLWWTRAQFYAAAENFPALKRNSRGLTYVTEVRYGIRALRRFSSPLPVWYAYGTAPLPRWG